MARPGTAPPMMLASAHSLVKGRARLGTNRVTSKTFVVAVDGTRMSIRAVRLAAWLCDVSTMDKIKCVSVSDGKEISRMAALENIKQGELELQNLGLRRHILPAQVLPIAEGDTVVETLNKAAVGCHLVLGAGGEKRGQSQGRGKAKVDPAFIGSVSLQCMASCTAPVILCKPKGTPLLDTTQGMQRRLATPSTVGTTIVVAVDGGHVSQKCFDMALRFVTRKDTVYICHVQNSDQDVEGASAAQNTLLGNSAVASYYASECAKAQSRFNGATFEFMPLTMVKHSVVETILEFTERDEVLADLIIMGSVELGKLGSKVLALGSVSAAIARRTPAHVLIAKHFAT